MNILCLNCEGLVTTIDPRKKYCGKICRHRYNVRKSRERFKKKEGVGKTKIEDLKAMIKRIEDKPQVVKMSVAQQVNQEAKKIDYEFNQEWRPPEGMKPPEVFVPFVKKNLDKLW